MTLPEKKEYLEQYSFGGDETLDKKAYEYSLNIGRFMLSFSRLESTVEYYLLELINDRTHEVGYQTLKYFKYKQKILFLRDHYISLARFAPVKVKEKLLKTINSLFKQLDEMGEFRNMICHADWTTLDKNYYVKTKVKEDENGIVFTRKKITCRELYNKSRSSDSLVNAFDAINEKILNKTIRQI